MRETIITCNYCEKVIKTQESGGRKPMSVPALHWLPAPHFQITNSSGEVFDFCSKDCIELGDFE